MPMLLTYPTDQLPPMWYWQVLSFLRTTWPEGFSGPLEQRTWITDRADHPQSFLIVEQTLLLAHVNVVWKLLEYHHTVFRAYGLTGVFTYPAVRGQGHGLRLVRHATAFIDAQAADIALLTCDPMLATFYERAGWEPLPNTRVWYGPAERPLCCEDVVMMRFMSIKGQRWQPHIEHGDLYFGENSPW